MAEEGMAEAGVGAGAGTGAADEGPLVGLGGGQPAGAGSQAGNGAGAGTQDAKAGWLLAEGVTGPGDAPGWFLKDKYKSVAEQAAAYPELQKRLGGFTGAPAEGKYELELAKDVVAAGLTVDPENHAYKAIAEYCAKGNASPDFFNGLVSEFARLTKAEEKMQETAEMERLGPDRSALVERISTYARANLNKEQIAMFKEVTKSADGCRLLDHLFGQMRQVSQPNPPNTTPLPAAQYTKEKLQQMVGDPRYKTDAAFRMEVEKAYQDHYGTEPYKEAAGNG